MADTPDTSGFGKFVPGFEFMQNLARQATGGLAQGMQQASPQLPNLGNWVAPTFNVEDLDKRIQELKAVHFWLDQNSRALAATIQALEVQKMTLATLRGMNVSMGDVANALKVKTADAMASMAGFAGMGAKSPGADTTAQLATPPASDADAIGSAGKAGGMQFAGLEIPPRRQRSATPVPEPVAAVPLVAPAPAPAPLPNAAAAPAAPATSVIDPMQWWGALTQQFQAIAKQAMQELPAQTAVEAGQHMATALASEAVKTATDMTAGVARSFSAAADAAAKPRAAAPKPGKSAAAAAKPVKVSVKVPAKAPAQSANTAKGAVPAIPARGASRTASAGGAARAPSVKAAAKSAASQAAAKGGRSR